VKHCARRRKQLKATKTQPAKICRESVGGLKILRRNVNRRGGGISGGGSAVPAHGGGWPGENASSWRQRENT